MFELTLISLHIALFMLGCSCHDYDAARYNVQVVVAGVVVAKALFWTDIVTVFGLLATDLGPGCYDHFNYDHLDVVPSCVRSLMPR